MRTITIIVEDGPCGFDIFEGDRHTDRLAWDEMLGQIAAMTHPKIGAGHYPMKTPEEWAREREERLARLNESRLAAQP